MTSPAEDLIKKAVELRENGQIDEAIIAARRATAMDLDNANGWWQLGLAVVKKDGAAAAIPHFKKTVELADGFSFGWHQLGAAYKETGMLDDAIASWKMALKNNEDRVDSLRALVDAYGERKLDSDEESLFGILVLLDGKGEIDSSDLNTLGIGYHKKKDFHKAINCYRRYVATHESAIGYFNLGLALSSPEISQYADAVDAWRQALATDSKYENAQKQLDRFLPRILRLRNRIIEEGGELIKVDQRYLNYVNPFELLNLTKIESPFDLDMKTIQKSKKSLLQEIELEDGMVEWVPGLRIDKSRAIKISDELTDENDRYWHHVIFENKPLLDFMSRGDVRHFLVDDEESPINVIKNINEWPGEFETLVGESFAAQFDLILTKAIEKRDVDLIEAILDGRRWVFPEQEDRCFEGGIRQLVRMIEPLRKAAEHSETVKPSFDDIRATLAKGSMGKIIGMLPISFQAIQHEAAGLIRSISIDANNHHDDAGLAKKIISLGKTLAGKSSSFLLKIEDDEKIFDGNIEAEKKKQEVLRIDRLLESLRQAAEKSERFKPRVESIREILARGNLATTLMALPSELQRFQDEAASLIRGISIDAYNHHDDADLAKEILDLGIPLLNRSSNLLGKICEDMNTINEHIKNESKDEAFLTYQDASYSITRKVVTFGNQKILVADVKTLRWGITVSHSGTVATYAFTFAVGGRGSNVLMLSWSAYKDLDAQRALFKKFVDASFAYLLPNIINLIKKDLNGNQIINFGTAQVSRHGITFTIEGWFSNKQEICPWNRLKSKIENGEAVITDISNSKCKIALPLATVDNAFALHSIINNQS